MCEHDGLQGTVVVPCDTHSVPGARMWTWALKRRGGACPCAGADRFVVADETAGLTLLPRADVVVARTAPSLRRARRVAAGLRERLPGSALVVVPVLGGATLLRGDGGEVVAERACPVCVYPWLARGGRLADLAGATGWAG